MNPRVKEICDLNPNFQNWSVNEQNSYINYWIHYLEGKSSNDDNSCLSSKYISFYKNKYYIFHMIFMFLFTVLIKYAKFIGYKNTCNDQNLVETYLFYTWCDQFDPENKARISN